MTNYDLEKISANHISHKERVSRIYNSQYIISKLNNKKKKKTIQSENEEKTRRVISQRSIYRRHISL